MADPVLDLAVPLVASFEGFKSHPYRDVAGVWTEGDGFIYLADGSRVTANSPPMSKETATILLRDWLGHRTLPVVREMVKVPVSNHMMAALVSFAYNEGLNALKTSTLLRDLNASHPIDALDQFVFWDIAGGHVVGGLLRRRKAEQAFAQLPDDKTPPL